MILFVAADSNFTFIIELSTMMKKLKYQISVLPQLFGYTAIHKLQVMPFVNLKEPYILFSLSFSAHFYNFSYKKHISY